MTSRIVIYFGPTFRYLDGIFTERTYCKDLSIIVVFDKHISINCFYVPTWLVCPNISNLSSDIHQKSIIFFMARCSCSQQLIS